MFLDFELAKVVFLSIIFIVSILYQIVLFFALYKKRKELNFLSAIKRDGNISKSGLFFFILMLIITYQSLFLDGITPGLVELMGIIVAGDLGATWVNDRKHISLERIKKTRDNKDVELSSDEFKDL